LVRHTATPPPPPTETAPIAVVGPDQTLNESSVVTLAGSASHDPDGDPITFAWDQTSGPPVQLSTPNQAKTSFTAPSNLQEDATMFFKLTVTDKTGLSDSMVQKITVKRSTSPPPPPENGTEQIYTPLPGGRVFTKMNPSGSNCDQSGIRFNLVNEHTLVDRESTWVFTLDNDPLSCTTNDHWSPKIGSHGSTGEGSGLYEASVPYKGGFKSMRTEGPHPQYHSCSGYSHGDVPPMPKGKPIGVKTAQWRIPNGVHVEFWYDFTGGGKGPWKKYASLDDTLPGHCNGGSIKGPIGMNGELIGPAKAQDTMRLNGGVGKYISGSIVELAPGQTPKGTISSIPSTSSLSSATDDNLIASHQAIAKESIFNKGLSDGEKDAKTFASASTMTSDQKTFASASTMIPDDVDCETPDNISGQDSIDYCKGYQQGFAEQNNTMQKITVKHSSSVPSTPSHGGGSKDKFGIKELYQSKPGGEEWFMNMDTAKDSRSDPPSLSKNADGSFRVSGQENIRYRIYTSTGYHEPTNTDQKHLAAQGYMLAPTDWKNVEMTGYVKVVQNEPSDNHFTWFARGGHHTSSRGCEGTALQGQLNIDGKTRFAKEQWQTGGYVFTPYKSSIVDSMTGKWIGFKTVMYNFQEDGKTVVMMQNWADKDNNGNWVKIYEHVDRGGLGNQGGHCGAANPDEIITWGGPIATFRWDNFNAVDIKNLSIREIQPPQ
jgi:hypothetical protein